jgi:hypothetical protein
MTMTIVTNTARQQELSRDSPCWPDSTDKLWLPALGSRLESIQLGALALGLKTAAQLTSPQLTSALHPSRLTKWRRNEHSNRNFSGIGIAPVRMDRAAVVESSNPIQHAMLWMLGHSPNQDPNQDPNPIKRAKCHSWDCIALHCVALCCDLTAF